MTDVNIQPDSLPWDSKLIKEIMGLAASAISIARETINPEAITLNVRESGPKLNFLLITPDNTL
jgi:hypothetical protein